MRRATTYQKCFPPAIWGVTGIIKGYGTGSVCGPQIVHAAPPYPFRNPFGKCIATPLDTQHEHKTLNNFSHSEALYIYTRRLMHVCSDDMPQ